jgi:DNA polymerase
MTDGIIGLDFETYGGVNLPERGLHNYVNDKTFTVLIASTYRVGVNGEDVRRRFDFVLNDFEDMKQALRAEIGDRAIAAHNAPFEQAVCGWLGYGFDHARFWDSAVVARAVGAAGKLEAAAPQLLGIDKVEQGKGLMKLFSIPGVYQEANDSLEFDPDVVEHHPQEWLDYGYYCDVDAELGYHIVNDWADLMLHREWINAHITHTMNDVGWPVDLELVHEMQRRYHANMERALAAFHAVFSQGVEEDKRLNFNSFPQLKKFCEERGVKAKSFDEEHVTLYLTKIRKRLVDHAATMPDAKVRELMEVVDLLTTKQTLGGSSLKKLTTILNQTSADGRLRGQYLHVGAGQTWRTSGKGVQMQNLKQLREVGDVDSLITGDEEGDEVEWDNEELARNLRQCFTASHGDGLLIVGDFKSVESRGLAYWAGAEWKLDEFRAGKDMYKVLAARIDGVPYDLVGKERRKFGKVGELSCGYGAGGVAVQKFAKKMGTILTEGEASQLVYDWRAANPEVVDLWSLLDEMLHEAVEGKSQRVDRVVGNGVTVTILHTATPESLRKLHPTAQSIEARLTDPHGTIMVRRYFHGCYIRGRNVCYYKPSELKSGDLWRAFYRDPKTDEIRFYSVYGGKLSGILTQSMCREMFFSSLRELTRRLAGVPNVQIIGQFHDEIVLDWWPDVTTGSVPLEEAEKILAAAMSDPGALAGFPLEADIKHDYRYTK